MTAVSRAFRCICTEVRPLKQLDLEHNRRCQIGDIVLRAAPTEDTEKSETRAQSVMVTQIRRTSSLDPRQRWLSNHHSTREISTCKHKTGWRTSVLQCELKLLYLNQIECFFVEKSKATALLKLWYKQKGNYDNVTYQNNLASIQERDRVPQWRTQEEASCSGGFWPLRVLGHFLLVFHRADRELDLNCIQTDLNTIQIEQMHRG